jgi:hypothetical protein
VRKAALPTVVVALLYALFLSQFVVGDERVEDVPRAGTIYLDAGRGASERIDSMRPYAVPGDGYDGQFALYMALDLPASPEYIYESTTYRLTRIGYPLAAAALALGQVDLVPWTLVLVNVLAAVALTFLLALHLVRTGASPVWALLVGAAPGLYLAVSLDTTEPLAYALVAGAWVAATRGNTVVAGVLFGLAGATREVALLFPLAWAAAAVLQRRYRDALTVLALSLAPLALVRLGVALWIGYESVDRSSYPTLIPFSGFHRSTDTLVLVVAVLAPSVAALVLSLAVARAVRPELLAVVLNALVLVVLLPAHSWFDYAAGGRISLGVLVAFCLYVPFLPPRARPLALVPIVGWMSAWLLDLPEGIPGEA